jgi:hypothetical protein
MVIKRTGTYAALLVASLAASPSGAQSVTDDAPSIIPKAKAATSERVGRTTGDLARRTVDEFTACLLGRRRRPTMEALALPSGSLEQSKALGKLGAKECIADGELNFSAAIFRGSLYTALVRTQLGKKTVSLGPEPVDYTKQPFSGSGSPPIPEVARLLNFASCVIHKDPANARDAILSLAGTPTEDAAMAELAKVYSQCLYSDQTIRFSKGALIGLLAEAYYREGSVAVQESAGS